MTPKQVTIRPPTQITRKVELGGRTYVVRSRVADGAVCYVGVATDRAYSGSRRLSLSGPTARSVIASLDGAAVTKGGSPREVANAA